MNIDKSKLKTGIWYEDADGNYLPAEGDTMTIPIGAVTKHVSFPLEVREEIYAIENGQMKRILTGCTHIGGGNGDVIVGMVNSGEYTLSEAISVYANCCERCANVLAWKYTNGKDGYPEFSEEWHKARTMCDFCKGEG